MKESDDLVAEHLIDVHKRIDAARKAAGRGDDKIDLIAVSKNHPAEAIRDAVAAGQLVFAENYAQELVDKQTQLSDLTDISWHFTGHLQSNKAKLVVRQTNLIQSVDSSKIAGKIARIAESLGITQNVLIEVNIGGDPGKAGVEVDRAFDLCESLVKMPQLKLLGLMGIAQGSSSGSISAKASFAALKKLFDSLPLDNRKVLSMGMSGDFEDAIAEGSTMVRIGTAIFGRRTGA